MAPKRQFIAIDLKSFYASVEAAERGYDPLDVNLVVADESRTDKTICLAVSPALKAHGMVELFQRECLQYAQHLSSVELLRYLAKKMQL